MIGLRIVVTGARQIASRFLRKSVTLRSELDAVTEANAQALLNAIRGRASGRPGPNVITGEYRASWHIEREGDRRIVTTNAPQGRRLERGFVGVDSLGRVYNQPPFPHVMPAADEIEGAFVLDVTRVAVRGI